MFNYLIVKDNLEFKNNSFSKMIAPFMYKTLSDSLDESLGELNRDGDEAFGENIEDLSYNFRKIFATWIGNRFAKIKYTNLDTSVKYKGKELKANKNGIVKGKNTITINKFLKAGPLREEYIADQKQELSNLQLDPYKHKIDRSFKNPELEKEKQEFTDNIKFIESKFGKTKDGEITFPQFINIGGDVYELTSLDGEEHDKSKSIGEGEKAEYTKLPFKGDTRISPFSNKWDNIPDWVPEKRVVGEDNSDDGWAGDDNEEEGMDYIPRGTQINSEETNNEESDDLEPIGRTNNSKEEPQYSRTQDSRLISILKKYLYSPTSGFTTKEISKNDLQRELKNAGYDYVVKEATSGGKYLTKDGNKVTVQYNKSEGEIQVGEKIAEQILQTYKEKIGGAVNYMIVSNEEYKQIHPNWKEGMPIDPFYHNGVAIIPRSALTMENLFHEALGHPTFDALEKHNPKLLNKIMSDLLQTDEGKKIQAEVKELYPELIDKKTGELNNKGLKEVGVRALTERAKGNINPETGKPFFAVIKRLFLAFKQMFRSIFGKDINISDLNENTTLQQLADMLTVGKGKIELSPRTYKSYQFIGNMPFMNTTIEKMNSGEQKITIRQKDYQSGIYTINGEKYHIENIGLKNGNDFKNKELLKQDFKGKDYEVGKFKHVDEFFEGKKDLYVYQITKLDSKIENQNIQYKKSLELKNTLEGADSSQAESDEEIGKRKLNRQLSSNKEESKQLSKYEAIYYRQISRLTKQLNQKGISDSQRETWEKELKLTQEKLAKYKSDKSEDKIDSITDTGSHLLERANKMIEGIEKGVFKPKIEDINYLNDIIETYSDFPELATEALTLKRKIDKLADGQLEELTKKYTDKTLSEANKQNKDIPFIRKWTGSLLDLDNIYANTIGKIIRHTQTKVERANKTFEKAISDKIKDIEKKYNVNITDIFKEVTHTSVKGNTSLVGKTDGLSPAALEFHEFYRKQMRELIKIMPTLTYRNDEGELEVFNLNEYFIPNVPVNKSLKEKIHESKNPLRILGIIKTRQTDNNTQDENDKADMIPLNYIRGIKSGRKTTDLGHALYKFSNAVVNTEEMSKILPQLRLLQEKIKQIHYKQPSNPATTKSGVDSGIYKIVDGFINAQVKGKYKKEQGRYAIGNEYKKDGNIVEDYIDITGTIDGLLRWNSLKRIGLSVPGAIANIEFGQLSNWIESIGGEHFNRGDLRRAKLLFFKQTFDKNSPLNKELLSKYNVLQEMSDYELEEAVKSGKAKYISKEKLMEYMYSMQKGGEKYIQSTSLMAMMLHDGYMDKNGELTKKWSDSSENEKENFILKVTGVNNKLHGRYSPKEAAIAQQDVFYRAMSQFRKFIPAAYEARFDKSHYSSRLGHNVEGRYLTFGREVFGELLKGNVKEAASNLFLPLISASKALEKGNLSANEIANIRKTATETLLVLGSMLLYSIGTGSSPDDKKRRKQHWYKATMLSLNRVAGDLAFFYSPEQLNNIGKNAIPMTQLTKNIIDLGGEIVAQFGKHPDFQKGEHKGENKVAKGLLDITPGANLIQDPRKIFNNNLLYNVK